MVLSSYYKKIIFWVIFSSATISALYLGVNENIIIFSALILSVFTEAFLGMGAFIASIPIVGPLIIKIITIPVFWFLNALSTLISAVAIKKGYATHLTKGRILTVALLIGIIIGYIIGNFIPLV